MTYQKLKANHQKEVDDFPLGAAFSAKQFEEMMAKWGLTKDDTDKIYKVGGGCFIRKSDSKAFGEMFDRHEKEHKEAMDADTTGEGYIYEMFRYELANHEYCITYDYEPALSALGLSYDEVRNDERMWKALQKARKDYLDNCD